MDHQSHEQQLKRNTIISAFSLFFQGGYTAILGLIANLVLTILLQPKIFGIYITVLSLISFLNYFSDIGLAASLIQKKELRPEDTRTTFTVQQILIISLIAIGIGATTFIKDFYHLPQEGVYLYWSLLFSFFISSLKTIPSVLLERKIEFQKIVFVQVIEGTLFYISVIIFAILGFGLRSFTIAVFLRALIGLIVIYRISFWMPQIGISRKSLKELLSFGVPFQASSFLALFKDDLIILYLGKVIGFEGVGYIGWAKKWAEAPIRIIMDNITKVLFPVIARYQEDKSRVAQLIEKVFYYQTMVLAPVMMSSALLMGLVVEIIPKYHKWAVALPMFYIFVLSSFLVSFSAPLVNLLNALGKVRISLTFMILWTVIMWIFTPTLTHFYGTIGFPVAHLLVSSTFIFIVLTVQKEIKFSFLRPIYKPILSAIILGLVVFILRSVLPFNNLITFFVAGSAGLLTYIAVLSLLFKVNLAEEIKFFIKK